MIICINCKPETKAKMDSLVNSNEYKDYSELVAIALDSFWMLEHEVAEKGAVVIGQESAPPVAATTSQLATKAKPLHRDRGAPADRRGGRAPKTAASSVRAVHVHIPPLFLTDGLEDVSVRTCPMPRVEEAGETFALDRWVFGQYNKLLPVKANCRALLRIGAEESDGLPVEDVARRIAEAAALLGDYLAAHDRRHRIRRDEALATAFPRSGREAEKSRARYANQFVGTVNSQRVLSGLLWDYRMATLAPGEGACLLPTEAGVQFARMANPVLDGSQTDPARKFSPEEAAFLLDHIRAHVPAEAFAFRTLIQAIAEGAITPDKLDEALRVHVPTETNRSLSPSFLTSQRSGALSRMADLGLIARKRKGVRVSYTITPAGEALVREGKA
jgi:Arc/MetJ-type ribon-helix-helix transcriptional regulator